MDVKQEQSDAELNRLVEIYKIYVQQVSNIDNLQASTNRFYQLLLSGLIVVILTFLRYKSNILPEESLGELFTENIMVQVGILGIILSWTWGISIDEYLKLKAEKYEVLKKLETGFEYQPFRDEAKLLDEPSYRMGSALNFFVPLAFLTLSSILLISAILTMPNKLYFLLSILPVVLYLHLLSLLYVHYFTDQETSDK